LSQYPQAQFLLSAADPQHFPPDTGAEVAFAGRSNAGKSTAINVLVGHHRLARTSKTPGRTRLLNFFTLAPGQRLVDLPGYGYASASVAERNSWARMINALAGRESLRGLMLLMDSRRGVLEGDEALIAWAGAASCPVYVLLSKADKLTRNELAKASAAVRRELGTRAEVQPFSAISGLGLDQARRQIDHWLARQVPKSVQA
jgi:GTP-binding protein